MSDGQDGALRKRAIILAVCSAGYLALSVVTFYHERGGSATAYIVLLTSLWTAGVAAQYYFKSAPRNAGGGHRD